MKTLLYTAAISLCITPSLYAGFRNPVKQAGQDAVEIERITRSTNASSTTSSYANESSRTPASSNTATFGPPVPQKFTQQKQNKTNFTGPIPKAGALPSRPDINIPQVGSIRKSNMPYRDPLPPIHLDGKNRVQVLNFARSAREMKLPHKEYGTEVKSKDIVQKYASALHPVAHKKIRTPYKINIEKIYKIKSPPSPISYENMLKRLDALFDALKPRYPAAVTALWELSQSKQNPVPLQARDALFAGIISQRAGWKMSAQYLMQESVEKKVDVQNRYLNILWNELESFEDAKFIDKVLAKVNPLYVKNFHPTGNKAYYSMAKRFMNKKQSPVLSQDEIISRINSTALTDRLLLAKSIAALREHKYQDEKALDAIRTLEQNGHTSIQQEARLAFARALLQRGSNLDALDAYKRIVKDGKNKLEVMSEQIYAEYKVGLYQESLGKSIGLQSPYFEYGFAPDAHMIEIMDRKALCDFGGAEKGVQRFVDRYGKELHALTELLNKQSSPVEQYEEIISYHSIDKPYRFQRFLLRNADVMENQKLLNMAQKELKDLGQIGIKKYSGDRPQGWDGFLAALNKQWSKKSSLFKKESAEKALAEAQYLANRLKYNFSQVELMGLDIVTAASRNYNMQSALNFPIKKQDEVELEADQLRWPFEQEIWEDELDFIKVKNPSKCASVASLQ